MADHRANHDVGGLEAGPIEQKEHRLSLSERRVDAMMQLLFSPDRRIFNIDEMRRAIETLPVEVYERYNYYERWMMAMRNLLVEKGILSDDEIAAKMADVRQRLSLGA
jgi:hypothetical protein